MLARKTRCKKKAEFESLRKQLVKLQGENQQLKDMIQGTGGQPQVRGVGNGAVCAENANECE